MKFKIGEKPDLIFSLILLFLLIVVGLSYFNFDWLQSAADWSDDTSSLVQTLQKTYSDFLETQTHYSDYLLTQREGYAGSCSDAMSRLQKDLKKLSRVTSGKSDLQRKTDSLQLLIQQKLESIQKGLAMCRAGRFDLAVSDIGKKDGQKETRELKRLMGSMAGIQAWLEETSRSAAEKNAQKNIGYTVFTVILGLLICFATYLFIKRQISVNLNTANRLKASETKFKLFTDTANDAFITMNGKGQIHGVNPSAETLFGYSSQELAGKPLADLISQGPSENPGDFSFEKFVSSAAESGAMEIYGRRKDTSEFPLEASLSRWEAPEGTFYTAILRDITDRKFFVKTLLNNERRLFQFLDEIPVGVLVRDRFGALYFANHVLQEIFGSDIIKSHDPGEQSPEFRNLYLESSDQPYPGQKHPISRAIAGEKSFVDDMEIRRHGKTIPLQAWGAPILDEHGMVKFALTSFIDVTRQKGVMESLREREEFFRNLFEEGPIGLTLTFPNNVFANVNRAFCGMLGYSKDDLVGKSFLEFTYPEDAKAESALSQKIFDKTLPRYQIEKRYVGSDGQPIWCMVTASVILDLNGQPMFRLAVVENITEQKEAEISLRTSEERFRTLAESANEGIVSTNGSGHIIFTNPAVSRIFGYTSDELSGRTIFSLMSKKTVRENLDLVQNYLATGRATLPNQTLEWVGLRKDGQEIPVEISYFSWKTPQGLFFTGILRDITARKQIDEMKRDLISVVSHQLKTPVAEINGYIENMLEGLTGGLNPKQREYLTDMKDIGVENYRLISDLLSMSKIERGVLTVDVQVVPLRQIVDASIRDYESQIQRKGLDLILDDLPEGLAVMADRDKTVETMRNVINNAIKCTDRGSITIRSKTEDNYAFLEVKDTGIGMTPQVMEKIFTRDRVMGNEASRSGAGLGMFIAKKFMNLQNGDISVESKPGKGSTFRVKIPIVGKEPS